MIGFKQKDIENILQELAADFLNEPSLDDSVSDLDSSQVNLSDVKVEDLDSENLCAIIATNRYLKLSNDLEIKAMQELASRRIKGDVFNFEKKISDIGSEFIPLNISIPDIMKISSQYRNKK